MTALIEVREPGLLGESLGMVEVCTDRLCDRCHRPMADGGAPFPGVRTFPTRRACASCWAALARFADNLPPHLDLLPLGGLVDTRPFPPGFCHHGVALEEPCDACDMAIAGMDDEEVID